MQVNRRITILILVLGGACLLLVGALIVPTVLAIREAEAKIAGINREIESRYTLRRHTRKTLNVMTEIRQRLRAVVGTSIAEGEELTFVSALEQAATDAGVSQDIVLETVNEQEISAWEKEIPLKIRVSGNYRDFLVYLRKIERLPFYVIILNLELTQPKTRERQSTGDVEAEIQGLIYWRSGSQPVVKQIYSEPAPAPAP